MSEGGRERLEQDERTGATGFVRSGASNSWGVNEGNEEAFAVEVSRHVR